MTILTVPEIRRGAQINENKFAFPNKMHSKNHASGWIAVHYSCRTAGLEQSIGATDMKHNVTTTYVT
jgi:hypothetical protein